ncbi:Retinol dehydrogenase 14 [Geodia barretti]|uniref:Retinol dehydrogenase 14 n=1 Tax=Geodia barretti TaxID=519541 RepID=A0AA35QT55_GEOBA|nr:Retinol dehydrogenase 14 [Geodia barretti]
MTPQFYHPHAPCDKICHYERSLRHRYARKDVSGHWCQRWYRLRRRPRAGSYGGPRHLGGRNAAKTHAAVVRITDETKNNDVNYLLADLSSQREVRRLAAQVNEQLPRLDVLLNNAGAIFLSGPSSVDGLEMTFALNHMGYFLLTSLLLDLVRDSVPARIINVSSSSHGSPGKFQLEDLPRPGINRGYRAYGRSKLCNILFTYELARRLEGTGVTVNALHPGLVRTNIARNNGMVGRVVNFFIGARGIGADKGADTLVYLASSQEVEGVTGKYYVDRRSAVFRVELRHRALRRPVGLEPAADDVEEGTRVGGAAYP